MTSVMGLLLFRCLPVVVGGTGLYLRALMEGLVAIPDIPEAVRTEARRLHGELGSDAFHARLAAVDPAAGGRAAAPPNPTG
jgi:tRNA dimethylallyltransferase